MSNLVKRYPILDAFLLSLSLCGCVGESRETENSDSNQVTTTRENLYLVGTPWTNGVVPVCWEGGGTNDAATGNSISNADTLRQNVRSFIENSWGRAARITFTGWGACPANPTHVTTLRWDSNYPRAACWGLGDPGTGVRPIAISPFSSDLQYRAVHEMGHALGMHHEQQRPDNFDANGNALYCFPSDSNTPVPGGTYLTPYDDDSIMNYCSTTSTLSVMDAQGAAATYGLPRLDFNGDNKSDLLWYNSATGELSYWYLNGIALAPGGNGLINSPYLVPQSTGWKPVGKADFNNDGQSDILWHNTATGELSYWYLNGTSLVSGGNGLIATPYLVPESTGWKVVGMGDFNDDGKSDILWHNVSTGQLSYWYLDGISMVPGGNGLIDTPYLVPESTGWRVVGTGDFNNDNHVDILWYNGGTGQLSYWYLDGISMIPGGNGLINTPYLVPESTGWKPVGTADFNSDGHADILWHNVSTGELSYWYLNGISLAPGGNGLLATPYLVPESTGWRVVNE